MIVKIPEIMAIKLIDRDERVRVATCNAFDKLDYETIIRYVNVDLFKKLGERLKDSKVLHFYFPFISIYSDLLTGFSVASCSDYCRSCARKTLQPSVSTNLSWHYII